ncbi:lysozyme murein hydrolase [Aeromonas phage phiAS5]|uniref:Lysozyme n=1 Tax=Aeromonas phage phiAS5 TaxID=879630 RepID=E1A2L4_9CAUD|nr:lysozyme murein hydrolase [Aeromonas phage phiAS5]ADM79960.1 lysozyme murein hydrolase [Aeromonas phage phiAS5]
MLAQMLKQDEGYKETVYWDTEGYPTIGIGHLIMRKRTKDMGEINRELSSHVGRNIKDGKISANEVLALFERDMDVVRRSIANYAALSGVYDTLDTVRKNAIENMVFQMGALGVSKFPSMLRALRNKDWNEAYRQALNSAWAKQTPNRANRVASVLKLGSYAPYGF